MTGRVQCFDLDVTDLELAAFVQESGLRRTSPGVFPVSVAGIGEVWLGPGTLGQLAHTREKIGVDVSLGHRDNLEPGPVRRLDVLLYVAVGINDQSLTGLPASDEIAHLRELLLIEPLEDHGKRISPVTARRKTVQKPDSCAAEVYFRHDDLARYPAPGPSRLRWRPDRESLRHPAGRNRHRAPRGHSFPVPEGSSDGGGFS